MNSRLVALAAALCLALSACAGATAPAAAGADSSAADAGKLAQDAADADAAATSPDAAADAGSPSDTPAAADAKVADAAVDATNAPDAAAIDAATADAAAADAAVADAAKADAAAADATAADVAPADVAPADAGPAVMCSGKDWYFPKFSKTCASDDDCVIANHMVNCCGSLIALGIAKTDKAAFDAAEKICDNQYPGCGCASQGTQAEDGFTSLMGDPIAVKCNAGTCGTYVVAAKPKCANAGAQDPKPFKFCHDNSECAWVPHQIDCCGSQMAVGIAKFAIGPYTKAEADCNKAGPQCECMSKQMTAEDGKTVGSGDPVVTCSYGACVTAAGP